MAAGPRGGHADAMDGTEVRGTLREMWETRPSRPRDGRKVAGVAAAIGRRYGVDPVLIRVGFVVAAFSGIGLPLYIAGWIVLPDGSGDRRRTRQRPAAAIGLVVLAFLTFGVFLGGGPSDGFGGASALTGAVLVGGLLFLLHRSRADRQPPVPTEPDTATVSLLKSTPGNPPSWDPLGTAPFAWDLPEPAQAPPPPPQRRAPVTAVTLALALITGGVAALLMLATGVLAPSSGPVLFGVVLAVLGLGLVAGSFLHAGQGLVPAAVLVGALTWGSLAAPFDEWSAGFGDIGASPTTPAQLEPAYIHTAGNVDLDLRRLDLSLLPGVPVSPVRTQVVLGTGDVTITVPADADLTLAASTGAGAVRFNEQWRDGVGAQLGVSRDLGADGVASGRPLEITVRVNAGEVEVLRG